MNSLSTPKSTHILMDEHMIKMIVNEGEIIEPADMFAMHEVNLKLSKNKPFTVLLDVRKHFTVTKEARELLASEKFLQHHKGSAFIVKTLAAKLTGNFFIRFNKPKNPTALFTNEEQAVKWLNKIIKAECIAT